MRTLFLVCAAAVALLAAGVTYADAPVRKRCPVIGSSDYFTPPGLLHHLNSNSDVSERARLSRFLREFAEPTLSCGASDPAEHYRLLRIQSGSPVVSVRVVRAERLLTLFASRRIESKRGEWRIEHTQSELTAAAWGALTAALATAKFWDDASDRHSDPVIFDGEDLWVIEGRQGSRYNIVARTAPEPLTEFAEACRQFLTQVHWKGRAASN